MFKISEEYAYTHWLPTDALAITSHLSDMDVSKNLLRVPYPYTVEHAIDWLNRNADFERAHKTSKNLAIRNNEGVAIGAMGLHFNYGFESDKSEFGYWIGKPYWNKGIMTEAVRVFCEIAKRDYRLKQLEAGIFVSNPASMKVLAKNGFINTGETEVCHKADGTEVVDVRFIKTL